MKTVYIKYGNNHGVIDYYLGIVIKAFENYDYKCVEITKENLPTLNRTYPVITCNAIDVLMLYIKGFRHFINWYQGTSADESYMRNKSWIRKFILHCIDAFSIRHNEMALFVSHYQREYFARIYRYMPRKTYIMPCYNCEIVKGAFYSPEKYEKNVFCYAGSLAVWQYFEETMRFYKRVEEKYGDKVALLVLTFDKDEARRIIDSIGIQYYTIDCVSQDKLSEVLSKCKFGFILREDNIVNNVATPTKLSTYLSAGLIPVFSSAIKEYERMLSDCEYSVCVNDTHDISGVEKYITQAINAEYIYEEYKSFYDKYFNSDRHIENISKIIFRE